MNVLEENNVDASILITPLSVRIAEAKYKKDFRLQFFVAKYFVKDVPSNPSVLSKELMEGLNIYRGVAEKSTNLIYRQMARNWLDSILLIEGYDAVLYGSNILDEGYKIYLNNNLTISVSEISRTKQQARFIAQANGIKILDEVIVVGQLTEEILHNSFKGTIQLNGIQTSNLNPFVSAVQIDFRYGKKVQGEEFAEFIKYGKRMIEIDVSGNPDMLITVNGTQCADISRCVWQVGEGPEILIIKVEPGNNSLIGGDLKVEINEYNFKGKRVNVKQSDKIFPCDSFDYWICKFEYTTTKQSFKE